VNDSPEKSPGRPAFGDLTPDAVLAMVETALGRRSSGICRPLNSYINRVYEVGMSDGSFVIAKFYRPGRWSREALQDEMDFVDELAEEELPVVPPIRGADGLLLHEGGGMYFALLPKKGGRALDEPAPNEWMHIGRLLARMHAVGARRQPRDRIRIGPDDSMATHLRYVLDSGSMSGGILQRYEAAVRSIVEIIRPLFEGVETGRIHGDCHRCNILHRPGEPFHLIDFDDMAVGPAVQDLWMLLPGRAGECAVEIESFLEGYETFHPFDRLALRLIEPLRAMRFLHYTAWCARQAADGGFVRLAPDWGAPAYWAQEIAELEKQRQEILDDLEARA
jgi:Ser/Thr protein kinase RdoA (MazF antagonist)